MKLNFQGSRRETKLQTTDIQFEATKQLGLVHPGHSLAQLSAVKLVTGKQISTAQFHSVWQNGVKPQKAQDVLALVKEC